MKLRTVICLFFVIVIILGIIYLLSPEIERGMSNEYDFHNQYNLNKTQKVDNLYAFTKIYGYIRFFHPSDENLQIDWNKMALYGVEKIKNARNDMELKESLEQIFQPIAPTMQIYFNEEEINHIERINESSNGDYRIVGWQHFGVEKGPSVGMQYSSQRIESISQDSISLFDQTLYIGEVFRKKLSDNLNCYIPLLLYKDANGTLGSTDDSKANFEKIQAELNSIYFSKATNNDEDVRLANIVIAWNYLQHFYPYFDVVEVNWEEVLKTTFNEVLDNINKEDFIRSMRKMLAQLQDGHAYVNLPWVTSPSYLPFQIDWVEDQIVVSNSTQSDLIQPGDIILKINDVNAKDYIRNLEDLVSGSPRYKRNRALLDFYGPKDAGVYLTILRGQEILEQNVQYNERKVIDVYDRPEGIVELMDRIYYMNLLTTSVEEFTENLNRLIEAKGIIFDLRYAQTADRLDSIYRNYFDELIGHIADESVQTPYWRVPQYVYPDQLGVSYYQAQGSIDPITPKITAKIVFLIDASNISRIETYLSIIEQYRLGEMIGQTTAGTNGNVNRFSLIGDAYSDKGKISVTWTGMQVSKQDGSQHHLIGISPTYLVERTLLGVQEGRDEYIEKALEVIVQSIERESNNNGG